jgi:hypothetical protein
VKTLTNCTPAHLAVLRALVRPAFSAVELGTEAHGDPHALRTAFLFFGLGTPPNA